MREGEEKVMETQSILRRRRFEQIGDLAIAHQMKLRIKTVNLKIIVDNNCCLFTNYFINIYSCAATDKISPEALCFSSPLSPEVTKVIQHG